MTEWYPAPGNSKFDPEHEALANRSRNIEDVVRALQRRVAVLEEIVRQIPSGKSEEK